MRKNISLLFTEKFIQIVIKINAGITFRDISKPAILLDINASNELLGKAVIFALDESLYIDDGQERLKRIEEAENTNEIYQEFIKEEFKNLVNQYHYKSQKALERDFMCVFISRNTSYQMNPCITTKEGYTGLTKVETINLPLTANETLLGEAARQAMSQCKSIYRRINL